MDLDEIQSVQSRERQTDSLQQLRDSFYEEAGQFVRALREERERAAARADDPFDAPEVNRLSDDIATAEQTLEAIYERRVGKIVKMASLAAADMPTEDGGLTTEEQDLFERLVGSIEDNRDRVFDVLEGTATDVGLDPEAGRSSDGSGEDTVDQLDGPSQPDDRPVPSQGPTDVEERQDDDVPAADLMGGDDTLSGEESSSGGTGDRSSPEPRPGNPSNGVDQPDGPVGNTEGKTTTEPGPDTGSELPADAQSGDREAPPDGPAATVETRGDGGTATHPVTDNSVEGTEQATPEGRERVDRTTVRITDDVGEILGVDDRAYDLAADDVVTLPATNATPLLEQGVAERME